MPQEAYRITSPVLGLSFKNGSHRSSVIFKGAVVHIEGETFNGNKLVEVRLNGKVVMMFTQDLRSRGEKL
jgi:hypothetical protein